MRRSQRRFARTLLAFALTAAACTAQDLPWLGDGGSDGGSDGGTSRDAAAESDPRLNLPRPAAWALGTWTGTMPTESAPGTPSQFAGKTVRLRMEAAEAAVSAPEVGNYYTGALTWDLGGAGEWTEALDSSSPSFALWKYDPGLHAESFDVSASHALSNSVDLSTTYLGSADELPQELVMDWAVTSGAVAESNGASVTARLRLIRQ